MTTSQDEIRRQILEQARRASEVKAGLAQQALAMRDFWRSVSPVESGEYAASVVVFRKDFTVNGMPAKRVGATDFKAHWIEFGTGEPGPTKAAAPRAKTAAHFYGDEAPAKADQSADSDSPSSTCCGECRRTSTTSTSR